MIKQEDKKIEIPSQLLIIPLIISLLGLEEIFHANNLTGFIILFIGLIGVLIIILIEIKYTKDKNISL